MPCVFPVLFLKGLALVQSSGEERSRLRSHGLVYTLGILVSFWVIVAVLLGLRAGGAQAGWGFQLQSPVFIAVLALGIFFFALSLAGQFELGLSFTSVGGELAQKQGFAGQLLYRCAGHHRRYAVHGSADGRGYRLCARTAGGHHLCRLYRAGTGACDALSAAQLPACVDAHSAAARTMDGDAQAAYRRAAVSPR